MFDTLLQIEKAAPLARPEAIWLGLGTVLMLLGTAYFLLKGWGIEDPEAREYYVITILIPAIAAASYFTMFTGFGLKEIELVGGPTLDIYWARYADWLFTTPLLLLDLALLADADRATILALVGLDGFMIVTGLWATLENVLIWRYVGWLFSEIALLFILYFLFTALTERAEGMDEDRATTFRVLRNLTVVLWFVYPIWWLLGTEGARLVSLYVETLGFMVLDVTAKVGFGFVLLRSRAVFGEGSVPEPSAAARAERAAAPDAEPVEDWTDGEVDYEAVVEGTVPEVKDAVENRSLDVERVLEAERRGDARVTLIEWLERRLDADAFTEGNRSNARFELYEDRAGRFRWRLRHRNGHVIADGGQGYASRRNARDGIDRVRRHVSEDTDAEFEVYEDDAGEFRWRLRHPNGNILADSGQGYASKQGAERGVASVERNAPTADAVTV